MHVELKCDGAAPKATANRMVVTSASFGPSCGGVPDNALYPLKTQCDGKDRCAATLPTQLNASLKIDCSTDVAVKFRCNDGRERAFNQLILANNNTAVNLSCTAPDQASGEAR